MTFKLRNFILSSLFIIIFCGSLFFTAHIFHRDKLDDDYLNLNSAPPTAIDTSRERIAQNHTSSSHIQSTPTSTNNTIYIKNFEESSPSIESKPKSIRVIANS